MPLLHIPPTLTLQYPKPSKPFITFPKPINPIKTLCLPSTNKDLLSFIINTTTNKNTLPCVRIYENGLCRLSLMGDVRYDQAVVAAAADGGKAVDEHLNGGVEAMVVETVFPGVGGEEDSTVSTRLFLPAESVQEKAKKLRATFSKEKLSSSASENILSITFRQVVLQNIWSFELELFNPGANRNMRDLENPRDDEAIFTVGSSDESVLSVFAEAICMWAYENTERNLHTDSLDTSSKYIFRWFQKPKIIASKDLSVLISEIPENDIVENALATVNITESYASKEMTKKDHWWTSSTFSKLENIGGSEFTNNFVHAFKLQVDRDKLKDAKFEGGDKSVENWWEARLTHSQMVGLAGVLDMYYEDPYSLPDKRLISGVIADFTNSSIKKKSSLWKIVLLTISSGIIIGLISNLAQLSWARSNRAELSAIQHSSVSISETQCFRYQFIETAELEGLCIMVVKKIKDAFGWPGDITAKIDVGAWTGELPNYLRRMEAVDLVQELVSGKDDAGPRSDEDVPRPANLSTSLVPASNTSNTDVNTSIQDIASYQVVLSKGRIVGFQPTSRVAVNQWASNPLANELYNGRKLSPGFLEPGLKIPKPDEVVLIELLMSVNPKAWFALARPIL